MTDDWPRAPGDLARALDDRLDAVLIRPKVRGKQYPKHVPADAVMPLDVPRPVPEDPDDDTPLCGAYDPNDIYSQELKPAETQSNREKWCRQCACVLAGLESEEYYTAPVAPDTDAGGEGIEVREYNVDPCPLCGEDYAGHLPDHIRENCDGSEQVADPFGGEQA